MASRAVAALVASLAISAVVLMVVGVWGYMETAALQKLSLPLLAPELGSYRAIIWVPSGPAFKGLAEELNATSAGSRPIRVEIVDLCSYAESPYVPRAGEGVLAIDTGKCAIDSYELLYYLAKRAWGSMPVGIELRVPVPKAIAVINTGRGIVVAAFDRVPTKLSALLLQLIVSSPSEPAPQLVAISVGNETSRAVALGVEEVSRNLFAVSMDLAAVSTSGGIWGSGLVELKGVGPVRVSEYEPSTTIASGFLVSKESYGNVVLMGVSRVLDRGDLSRELVKLVVEPRYDARAVLFHSITVLKLGGREARALLELSSFDFTTLETLVLGR